MQSSRDSPSNFHTYLPSQGPMAPPDSVNPNNGPTNPNILTSRGGNGSGGNVVGDISGGYFPNDGMAGLSQHHQNNLLRGNLPHAAAYGNTHHASAAAAAAAHTHGTVHSHHGHHMHPHGIPNPHSGHLTNSTHRPSKLSTNQQNVSLNGSMPPPHATSSFNQLHHGMQHSLQQQQQQQSHVNQMSAASNVMSSNATGVSHYNQGNMMGVSGMGGSAGGGVGNIGNISGMVNSGSNSPVCHGLCDVWHDNLKDGIKLLRCLSLVYNYVAIDTEFPGIVAKVSHDYLDASEQAYQNIRINLNLLKPIQIGFSFMNEGGITHEDHCTTVQFNMRWNVDGDVHAIDSIKLLENSGIDFTRLKTDGVLPDEFAAELTDSGAVLNSNLKHIGYHSAYDWAYLLKLLTGWTELPDSYAEYHQMLSHYFPTILDVKVYQANLQNATKGGLQELADSYNIPRYGAQHQAGSDARLTGEVYFRVIKDERCQVRPDFDNLIFGLNYGQGTHLWVPTQQVSINDSMDLVTSSNHNHNISTDMTSSNKPTNNEMTSSQNGGVTVNNNRDGNGSEEGAEIDNDEEEDNDAKNSEEEAERFRNDENQSSSGSSQCSAGGGSAASNGGGAGGGTKSHGSSSRSLHKEMNASNLSLPTTYGSSATGGSGNVPFDSNGDFLTLPTSSTPRTHDDDQDAERHSIA